MRQLAGFLLLTVMVFFLYAGVATEARSLRRYCRGFPKAICSLELRHHCGSDGKTYPNKCAFCNAYVESGRKLRLKRFGECRKNED